MRFDKKTYRKGTGSLKWDENPNIEYPLWVADMDFEVAPSIKEALEQRVHHGIFGYALPTDSFYESIIKWHLRRHHALYRREWIITVPGVVPAISSILRALTKPGDGVLTLSPVYNCFYSSIRNLQCRAEESVLRQVGDTYQIDFDDLERRASKEDTKVLLLCSPHNPSGRVWTQEELQRIGDICLKNNVFIVSDEIHCELVMPGHEFIPYATLGNTYMQEACICTSASKSFNIAGLQNAQIICPNEEYRKRIDRAVNIHEVCDVNPFGIVATEAAYNEGEEWLEELCQYIWKNYRDAKEYIEKEIPKLRVIKLEGTYLMWVDIRALDISDETFCRNLREQESLWLAEGSHYGRGGEGFIRINLATQHENVMIALEKLKHYIDSL